jgi:hypothetical protein
LWIETDDLIEYIKKFIKKQKQISLKSTLNNVILLEKNIKNKIENSEEKNEIFVNCDELIVENNINDNDTLSRKKFKKNETIATIKNYEEKIVFSDSELHEMYFGFVFFLSLLLLLLSFHVYVNPLLYSFYFCFLNKKKLKGMFCTACEMIGKI